ncbi:MAG: 5-(carboxyamino)imidazole ribonucleotide synthase [Rhizobiaceae bacterium]|nr:5-(carboxyamino)imidazole ribonucleotide synthase [Rhizobiaceae bacterium]
MAQTTEFPFLKEKTIGILGGGQLARMLGLAAGRLGFSTIILDPAVNCPAAQFANHQIVAKYDDEAALIELAGLCSVVTYEFENVPVASAKTIQNTCAIYPPPLALEISQDRLHEKRFIQSAGLKTAQYIPVANPSEMENATKAIGLPAIMKTRRMGYDGKGQIKLGDNYHKHQSNEINDLLEVDCILEEMVDFECEISIIGARDRDGNTACYDPARNVHLNGILISSTLPCDLAEPIIEAAKTQTAALMAKLDYVGVIGVEFFVTKSGELLINEFAPRVHNSGHWTEAACLVSQFEQHIRAISGLKLGSTARHSDCVMQNLIGEEISNIPALLANPDILAHDYGKQQIRPGRKMGHFTTIFAKELP